MKSNPSIPVLILVLALMAILTGVNCQQTSEKEEACPGTSKRLLSLFDWNAYMVFLTQAKYRVYQLNYYTAINKWSDLTPNESKHLLSGDISELSEDDELTDDASAREALLEILGSQYGNTNLVERELKKRRPGLPYDEKVRRRRSVEDRDRELMVANLVKGGESCHVKPDPNLKIRWIVSSDNPDYEPSVASTSSEDLQQKVGDIPQDEITELAKEPHLTYNLSTAFSLMHGAFSSAINWLTPDRVSDDDEEEDNIELDENQGQEQTIVIRDWRQSGCIGPARDQGYCASCYAISSIGFLEWALCSQSRDNKFTPLSIQYMVSCGLQLRDETQNAVKLNGCSNGVSKHTQNFIREYGVELEANMPYVARETQCPIEKNLPRKKKGYIRPNVRPPMRLGAGTSQLDLALKVGPVIVSMREPVDFLGYGGGMVENCEPNGGHAMLIVGNMIQDGEEYLLIKNSFGPYWGYNGFFKFRRSSIMECVKEFIVPMISFPGRKSQDRRVKAYIANQQNISTDSNIDKNDSVISLASLVSGHQK